MSAQVIGHRWITFGSQQQPEANGADGHHPSPAVHADNEDRP
ncbi:hypothetical protein [Nocardiopsis ansamitocini]|nr:hypothetical protein [Nocardiopsis ansamitocini]